MRTPLPFDLRRAQQTSLILALFGLLLSGCVATRANVTIQPALACSKLIPDDWRRGVQGANMPTTVAAGEWLIFGDAQTAKLNEANGRTRDSIAIVEKCEAREAAIAEALKPKPWWKRVF